MGDHARGRDPCAFPPRVHAARQAGCAGRSRDQGRLKPASAPPMRGAPVCAESLLAKNGGDPVKAFQEGQILFNSSAIYAAGMAAHHGNTSAISSVSAGPTLLICLNLTCACEQHSHSDLSCRHDSQVLNAVSLMGLDSVF